MRLLQDILVATDFSQSSDQAVQASILMAKEFKSRIVLLHVAPEESVSEQTKALIEQSIHSKLAEIKGQIIDKGVSVSEVIIENGVPFEKIIQVAQARNVNVIVAGSGSKDKDDSFKLGTTVEKLMRKNQIPLWVVKNEEAHNIKKIVCPVDFSDSSIRALQNAITLANKFESELSIVHVFEPVLVTSARFSVNTEEENRKNKERKEREFEEFLKAFDLGSVAFSKNLLMGDPFLEILRFIKREKADLLVMGTTGKTSLSRLLMGSVTEKVTREVPISFITTKARDITNNYLESNLSGIESVLKPAQKLFKEKNFELAIEKYIIGIKQYPDNIPLIKGLIQSYLALGDKKKAEYYKNYGKDVVKRIWGDSYLDIISFEES